MEFNEEINSNINKKGGKNNDYWREYLKRTKMNVFDVIEQAIMLAALDYPNEYRVKKAGIAELLFSCKLTRCQNCNHDHHDNHDYHGDDHHDDDGDNNISYGEIEALNDLIEEEKEIINEVLRIKDVLYNSQDESDKVLFESLRRLQLMHLSINVLKETEIGKAVNHIKKHTSQDVRHLARSLIAEWKIIVDEWMKSTQEITEGGTPDSINRTPDSINPSTVDEEEGLPSPPMDDGVFFSTQPMDFTQFFDGMDDYGNPRNCGEFNKNRESGRKPSSGMPNVPKRREEATPISKDNRVQQTKRQSPLPKPSKPSNTQPNTGRLSNPEISKDPKFQLNPEKPAVQRRPVSQPEKPRLSNEDSVQEKLEATKRKLQERYQQAENAKRQRTIQVMEIQDLPKQALVNKNPHAKFGNNRQWANGRK